MSEEDSSDGSDAQADEAHWSAPAGSDQYTEPHRAEHYPSQSCDPPQNPVETSSSDGSGSEPDAESEPDHSERQCMEDCKDELDEDLFPGSKVTRAESLLMVMAHSLRHGSSKEATESLLQLLSAHLPAGVSYQTSKYTFFRHFCGAGKQYAKHFYCSRCSAYIGELVQAENRNDATVRLLMHQLTREKTMKGDELRREQVQIRW
ncbi:uncharacterized protein LOC142574590 [Dermacentor variabilis]|uniref:uncharacterized protein LOC142574590 n=1 Tax=Dermacentor variabilis TaxID=34621 RepID=UPI003F5C6132